MKNKDNFKKYLILVICAILVFGIIFLSLNIIQYKKYTENVNNVIGQIIANIKEKYPDVKTEEIIQILNSDSILPNNLLSEYGIDLQEDSVILSNNGIYMNYLIWFVVLIIILLTVLTVLIIKYNRSQNKKIKEIENYIEEISNKNYALDIQDNGEDELSVLKNELYKITIMLKEQAENSKKDKLSLKKSLEDISHQLKTPLTSITIMLDNILDNPNMDVTTRNDFIKDIHREVANINFFIQSLLKLSKFDANTIEFNRKEESLQDIVEKAIKNVSMICDLKNIEIVVENYCDAKILCDLNWQIEAVTNILKNSVEHSDNNAKIYIALEKNSMYSEIKIKDNGIGIDKKDLKHIFERFYKGKNSGKDSVGIGLSLAKTIIEKDNGYITVDSKLNKETVFKIRYMK